MANKETAGQREQRERRAKYKAMKARLKVAEKKRRAAEKHYNEVNKDYVKQKNGAFVKRKPKS